MLSCVGMNLSGQQHKPALIFSLEDAAALSCLLPERLSVGCQRLDSATYAEKP